VDGLIFGMIDNGVLILGAYTGLEIDRFFEGRGALGAVIGAGIGNTVSDGIGASIDPSMSGMVAGVIIGCLLPMVFIPVIEYTKGRVKL
jgi:hypothetical protein